MVKNLPAMRETWVGSLGWKDPLKEGMTAHSSILAWENPQTKEPGGLQSMWSQRVGHNWGTNHITYIYVCVCVYVCTHTHTHTLSRSVMSNSSWPHWQDCSPPGSSVHGDSSGKNTGVGCYALLQGIFPTQGSNPGPLHCRWVLYHLSHQGSPATSITLHLRFALKTL